MSDRPKFEEFKKRLLAKPEVRKAYVSAKVRRRRQQSEDELLKRREKS